jgi:thiosulfate/3-mercaptopyruvate sulfurtransferase
MKRVLGLFFGVIFTSLVFGETPSILVTPAWVAEHIKDHDVVVLHVAQNRHDYLKGHIAGARFLWPGWMAMSNPDLSYEALPVPELGAALEKLGVSNDSRIVLCGVNGNVSPTARMFITLDYLGMGDRTFILDGGLEAWMAAGYKTTTAVPEVKRSSFHPKLKKEVFVHADYVKERLGNPRVSIIDARAPEFYSGKNSGGSVRAGHIPGAQNLFFTTLFDTSNKYLPIDSLKAKFEHAGVKTGNEVIPYCHVGQTASPVYIVARLLGYTAHLNDGSFEEWGGREDLPIEPTPK